MTKHLYLSVSSGMVSASLLVVTLGAATQRIAVDHFVMPIKQDKTWHCWAASTAMINNWRRAKTGLPPLTAEQTATQAGAAFVSLYAQGDTTGINPTQEAALYKALSFGFVRQQNPTIASWADMLRTRGPLGVTIAADPKSKWPIHEIVLTTMKGDGTPNGTTVGYVDPDDGLPHTLTFQQFVALYEAAAGYVIQIAYAQ